MLPFEAEGTAGTEILRMAVPMALGDGTEGLQAVGWVPLTVPADLATYKTAITEALYKGTKRNVESEEDPKNAAVE